MSDEQFKKIFSKRLRYYMKLNEKTQMDLINDLGLSSSTVSNWCTGLKLPRMGKIQLLADYFGILKTDLIEDKKADNISDNILSEEEIRLLNFIKKNPEYRNLFNSIISNTSKDDLSFIEQVIEKISCKKDI